VTLFYLRRPWQADQKSTGLGFAEGEALDSMDLRPTVIRWFAVAFSLGAWAAIVLVALKLFA
jgi:hypothetical protein